MSGFQLDLLMSLNPASNGAIILQKNGQVHIIPTVTHGFLKVRKLSNANAAKKRIARIFL